MNNLFLGIITIILCSIGYFFSWKYQVNKNYKISILLLVICGLALRIFSSSDFFLHTWDERYHALVAKNLIQHPLLPTLYDNPILPYDYKNWAANHIWLHKQPLPLWTMAASMWFFGVNEIGLRLPSIILTTIGIWLTYLIGRYFFNNKVGYLTAFFYSINGLIIELTSGRVATDHIDVFFLFFVELAIYFSIVFAQRRKTIYNFLAGVSIGAAILSKWLPALIILPIWFLIVFDSGNFRNKIIFFQFIILLTTCFLVFLPWQLYIFKTFPVESAWENSFNFKHITEVLDERSGAFYYFINKIRINYGELIYLPILWFLWKTISFRKNIKRLAITIWFFVPFIFFSFVKTKMQAYILFTSPALFLMTSEFYFALVDFKKKQKTIWLYNLILILLIALPIRYTIERIKPFEQRERTPKWVTLLKKLNGSKLLNGVLFNYEKPIEAMFYTNLIVYSIIPDKNKILNLIQNGYIVYINDNGKIPIEVKSIKGVVCINLNTTD